MSGPEHCTQADEFVMLKESNFKEEEENTEQVDGKWDFTDA